MNCISVKEPNDCDTWIQQEMGEVKAQFRVPLQYLHEKLEENHEKPQGSWFSGEDMSL